MQFFNFLPETGIVDENTLKCIFPAVKIEVISPNGGENLTRNQIQKIKGKVTAELGEGILKSERYFWHKATIDLFRRVGNQSTFVKHTAIIDLFDTVYFWKITPDIPNGERKERFLPPLEEIWPPLPLPPWMLSFDESDGTFTIFGEIERSNFSEIIKILEKI